MNLIHYLNQAFPKAESKWKVIISISLFVSLFLIIFQPFGLNLMDGNSKTTFLAGYGIITFLILIVNLILIESLFPKIFDERNWTIWKEFLWLLWVVFSIGLGNAFYTSVVLTNSYPTIQFIVNFQITTLVVAILPITVLIISKQKYLLRKHLISATDLNKSLDKEKKNHSRYIRFFADNEKDFIEFDINNFYFIESSGNYIEIFLFEENKIIRKTYRSTLKRALEFFKNSPEIIQCHRAFIINTNKIINAKGNSQGLKLNLKACETEIPVSRGFVNSIRKKTNTKS